MEGLFIQMGKIKENGLKTTKGTEYTIIKSIEKRFIKILKNIVIYLTMFSHSKD